MAPRRTHPHCSSVLHWQRATGALLMTLIAACAGESSEITPESPSETTSPETTAMTPAASAPAPSHLAPATPASQSTDEGSTSGPSMGITQPSTPAPSASPSASAGSADSSEPSHDTIDHDTGDVSTETSWHESTEPTPAIELPPGVERLFPLPGSTSVCPDPTLHLWFPSKPTLGSRGKIAVYDAAAPGAPVASVDLAQSNGSDTVGGSSFKIARWVFVDGNEVIVTFPAAGLGYGKTYYVTIEAGAITGPNGAFAISYDQTWRFSTASEPPTNTTNLRVALDHTADFCTLQRAIEVAKDGTTIEVGPGNYYGLIYFKNKRNLTIRGEDRERTAIKGINNNNLNPSTRTRALFGSESVTGLTLENLTIHNLTPQDGSQAEALALLSCDQCVVRDANILSLQDTLLWSGRIYAEDCYVAGNVDYIWGTGTVYFNRCQIHTVGRKGYNVQARNGSNAHGYVFVDSKLTSDPGITGDVLARIDVSAYPNSEVAYIDCEMGPHIAAAGWLISGGNAPQSLRFLEYQSRTPGGGLVDVSKRLAGSRQLTSQQALTYRDPAQVLGGWSPPVRP